MAVKVSVNPLPALAVRSDYLEFRTALLSYLLEKKAMNLAFAPLHVVLVAMTPNQVARQRRDVPDVQPPAGNAGHVAATLYSAELEYQRKNNDIMDDIEGCILRSMTPSMQAHASAAEPFAGLSLREKIAAMDLHFMTFNTSELVTYQDELRQLAPGKTLAENLVRFRQVHLILQHANHPETDANKHLCLTRALEQQPRYRSFLTAYNYKDEPKTLARLEREVLLWDSQSPDLLDAPTAGQAYGASTTPSPLEHRLALLEQAIAALKPSRTDPKDNPKVITGGRNRPIYWQADKATMRTQFCARHGFTSTHDTSACRAAPFPVDTSTPAKLKAYLLTL